MARLSLDTLAALPSSVQTPRYDSARAGIGIVHFGPSAFFRAHVAAYIDSLLAEDPRALKPLISLFVDEVSRRDESMLDELERLIRRKKEGGR